MSTWAIVPFRGSSKAKRRLEHAIPHETRSRLVLAMLDDVLEALTQATILDGILLVSRSPEATDIARKWGITQFKENGNSLVEALVEASDALRNSYGARTAMIVPGDVPLITGEAVDAILRVQSDVTVVPDANKVGTNALVCRPPNAFPYVFDGRSFHPHVEAALNAGLKVKTVQSELFNIDVDTYEDLIKLGAVNNTTRTGQLFQSEEALRALVAS